jgi:hypothetical protein
MARLAASVLAVLLLAPFPAAAGDGVPADKLDFALRHRLRSAQGAARVIIQTDDRPAVERLVTASGGTVGRHLAGIRAVVADRP